ncbi:desaturase [Corallococcus sp. 4LFB]|uniref:desaturase n=1 Tax=Corallococcus sp. 4LFB TaxID=3383249 RepID=UPI003975A0E2
MLPRNRVDLLGDAARRRAELTREFGEAGEGIQGALTGSAAQHEATDAFFKQGPQLPPDGFFDGWKLKGQIKEHPALEAAPRLAGEEPALALVRGLLPFLVHLEKPSAPLARTRALSQVLTAPSTYPGGMDALRDVLTRRLTELGGDVLGRDNPAGFIVEELAFDGSKFSGVKLVRSDTLYRASCLVTATDSGALRRLVTDKKHHRGLLEHLDQSNIKSLLFSVNWVVPEAALPRGMGELVLVDTQDAELGPLLVQQHPARTSAGTGGKDVEGVRVVCAGAFVPATARDEGEEHLKVLAARIDEHLDRLMPFTKQHRALRSVPYLDAGGVRGSRLMPHPLYSFETEAFLGVTGLKQRTPSKNVILAGREVLPGLGLEGELLAGMRAARLVQDMLKKKDPLKG